VEEVEVGKQQRSQREEGTTDDTRVPSTFSWSDFCSSSASPGCVGSLSGGNDGTAPSGSVSYGSTRNVEPIIVASSYMGNKIR
jgi:hypothetical protein